MIWIGFDPRQAAAFSVCRESARYRLTKPMPISGLVLRDLQDEGVYWRPTEGRSGTEGQILWDTISDWPMSTEFAISRFFVPHLMGYQGWALFMDSDMLVIGNLSRVFEQSDTSKAVYCVKHDYTPSSSQKMDGQRQAAYPRKNWSSFMLFNCAHPSNRRLNVQTLNERTGRDLHRFCWLEDDEIGELDPGWNWLVGEQPEPQKLKVIHYTNGGPWFHAYADVPYADLWRSELNAWAA